MPVLPVTELVPDDGDDLVLRQVLEQRVEEHDPLVLPEAEEVRVRVRRALGAVHLEDLHEREVDEVREVLDLVLERSVLQLLELVVDRSDEVRLNSRHEHRDEDHERLDLAVTGDNKEFQDIECNLARGFISRESREERELIVPS